MLSAVASGLAVLVLASHRTRGRTPERPKRGASDVDARMRQALVRAALPTPGRPFVAWVSLAFTAALIGLVLFGPGGVVVGLGMGLGLPPLAVGARGDRTARLLDGQLPELLEQMARTARSGATTSQAVADASVTMAEPMASDLARVVALQAGGCSLVDSLTLWAEERDVPAIRSFVAAVTLGERLGGAQSVSLDGLAMSQRANAEVAAEARALASQAVSSAVLIGSAPIAFGAVLALTGTSQLAVVLQTRIGTLAAVAGIGLELLGAIWMRRIVRA